MGLSRYENKDFLGEQEQGKEPKRYNDLEELRLLSGKNQSSVDDVDQRIFGKLAEMTDIRYRLGIIQGKDGKIPDADGVPRMFIMGISLMNVADKVAEEIVEQKQAARQKQAGAEIEDPALGEPLQIEVKDKAPKGPVL